MNENTLHSSKNELIGLIFGRIHVLTICVQSYLTFTGKGLGHPTVHHVNSSCSSHEKDLRLDHTKNSGALGFLVHRKLIQLSYIKAFNFDSILTDIQRPFD